MDLHVKISMSVKIAHVTQMHSVLILQAHLLAHANLGFLEMAKYVTTSMSALLVRAIHKPTVKISLALSFALVRLVLLAMEKIAKMLMNVRMLHVA